MKLALTSLLSTGLVLLFNGLTLAETPINILRDINNSRFPLSIRHPNCGQFTVSSKENLIIKWSSNGNTNIRTLEDTLSNPASSDKDLYLSLYGFGNDRCPDGFPVDNYLDYFSNSNKNIERGSGR